jgi:cytidylate kinase
MPLRQTEDAILVDTSDMAVDEALSVILGAIRQKEADKA